MKNIFINEYGVFLGVKSELLVIKKDKKVVKELPLSRIKTIQISSKGVSLSSNLILSCASRGIKILLNSYSTFCGISSLYEHKSVVIRQNQYETIKNTMSLELARKLITGKLKNQRSTILYITRNMPQEQKQDIVTFFDRSIAQLKNKKDISKEFILGIEGVCAERYFNFLRDFDFLPSSFLYRTKRNSDEITNIALNFGYTLLLNFVYKSILNAGLEPYMGVLHSQRSSKPSLALDIMEEYRSFVVDRNIIKLRFKLQKAKSFLDVKKDVVSAIYETMGRRYKYNKRKLTLESILQRQVYKIAGFFAQKNSYKPYVFRW